MKTIKSLLLLLFVTLSMQSKAQSYNSYYHQLPVGVAQPKMVTIPNNQVSITEFGGVGDGITLNTEAFRKAISALTKKGGGRGCHLF